MKSGTTSLLALLLAVSALLVAFAHSASSPVSVPVKEESAYDRVIRTNTLRCGFGTWEPGVYRDLQTGKMAGFFVELVEELGKLDRIKIEWGPETDWGQIPEAINTGKIDAFCAGMADDAMRGRQLAYTNPLSFWTFDVLVRANDTRFAAGETIKSEDLDKEIYATAYTEGDVLETIIKNEFPNVKAVSLPPLGTPADNLMDVTSQKTDFVIFPKVMFESYEKTNPGQLRYLKIDPPLRAYGNVIAVGMNDLQLQQLLNAGVNELVNSAAYLRILSKYDRDYPDAFLRIAPSYLGSEKL